MLAATSDRVPSQQPSVAPPDLAAVKKRQQATWASGDFSVVAARIVLQAELLCEAADLQADWHVLDVATGSGNAAIAAARRGCSVVGADYVPALLEAGRIRAKTEHLEVDFVEGDAENLPFPNASFDAVLSIYGAMFAPNHHKTAAELARVCRPGGVIALASWTPEGFIGEMFRLFSKYITPAAGLTPPIRWGDEAHLRAIFGGAIRSMTSQVRTAIFRFASAEDNVHFFRTYYGPTLKTFEALPAAKREALEQEMIELNCKFDRNGGKGGPVAITADYLETVIVRA
ncbi:MAG TPA: methyltransferase domain-containing protein [Gemmataceae bacterium]|nr:methyltransferase domain-containing protein [Gemmataceae bacterium]